MQTRESNLFEEYVYCVCRRPPRSILRFLEGRVLECSCRLIGIFNANFLRRFTAARIRPRRLCNALVNRYDVVPNRNDP